METAGPNQLVRRITTAEQASTAELRQRGRNREGAGSGHVKNGCERGRGGALFELRPRRRCDDIAMQLSRAEIVPLAIGAERIGVDVVTS